MDSTIGLKITSNDSFAKCVSIVRKYEPLSIGEIKSRISSKKYVLVYDYTDDAGLNKIIKCYKELSKIGISSELYEDDEVSSIELFNNLNSTYQEIADEVEAAMLTEDEEAD